VATSQESVKARERERKRKGGSEQASESELVTTNVSTHPLRDRRSGCAHLLEGWMKFDVENRNIKLE